MQLRANGERAVLVGHDGTARREVDPRRLPLGGELTDALHEWARVADVVSRGDADTQPAARAVITRRGLQLAGRIAASMGVPVGYLDPLTGEEATVEPPAAAARPPATRSPEPTPWLTGLTVAAVSLVLAVVTIVTLAATLADTNVLLALASNIVVTAGLLPSLWLVRTAPTWRWVAYGVTTAIAMAWLALPFILW
ncbi:DUF2537 domain-containing protein [Actinophytocola sediminis]